MDILIPSGDVTLTGASPLVLPDSFDNAFSGAFGFDGNITRAPASATLGLVGNELDGGIAKLSQAPVEVLIAPSNPEARLSQAPVETLVVPPPPAAQVSQIAVEVLLKSGASYAKPPATDISLIGFAPQAVLGWTRFYVTNRAATYTPATLRGAWDDTAVAVTKRLENAPLASLSTDDTANIDRAETNASNTWDVLLYRGVSGPLAAQTIAGNVDVCLPVRCYFSNGNFRFHVHIYVTQGDSDTPRGTLLTDYVDSVDWAVSAEVGQALAASQALASLAISDGDRVVVEIGYRATNSDTTSRTGRLVYGWNASTTLHDLRVGETSPSTGTSAAGYVEFQSTITPSSAIEGRVSQLPALTLIRPDAPEGRIGQLPVLVPVRPSAPEGRIGQLPVLVLVLPYTYRPPSGTIALSSAEPTLALTIPVPSGAITLTGSPPDLAFLNVSEPPSGQIDLIGQASTLALTVLVPSGVITFVSDPPTVIEGTPTATGVQLTALGQLVAIQPTERNAQLTAFGENVLDHHPDVAVLATALAQNVLDTKPDVAARLSGIGLLVLSRSGREIEPEIATSFGPLVWVEWTASDGSLPVWAPVDLPDPATYYRGYKSPQLLRPGIVHRGLSDENGDLQQQSFEVEISDVWRTLRALLGQPDARRHLVNSLMVMRMISDADRRLLKVPRTVAIGVVRGYELG